MKNIGRRGVVTEEEAYQARRYKNDLLRHAYWQNEVQFETEKDREVVLMYLDSKIPLWNLFDRPTFWYLRFQNQNLYSKKRYPKEAREMEELSKLIFNEVPLEEDEDAPEILSRCKNPR